MPESQDDAELILRPRKEDVLFGPDTEHPMASACLNFTTSDYGYREGYRMAGRMLAAYVCRECKHQDLLVFLIVFNYRHHIELMLKHLIGLGAYLSDTTIDPGLSRLVLKSHDLDQLWGALRPILFATGKAIRWTPNTDDIEGVDSYIRQLHTVDRGSFSFRYATDTAGSPSLPGMIHLNIYEFATRMECLAEYFDTIAFGFSMAEDRKSEYETYLYSLYCENCE